MVKKGHLVLLYPCTSSIPRREVSLSLSFFYILCLEKGNSKSTISDFLRNIEDSNNHKACVWFCLNQSVHNGIF